MKSKITQWIDDHDDRWSFIVFYIGLSVVFSIYFSLFWVSLLALCHFGLEVGRHMMLKMDRPALRALWEVKLDIALILMAINLSLYSDVMMAALGLGQTVRAASALRGAQMATRFAVIQRALRIIMMTMDDMARIGQTMMRVLSSSRTQTVPASGNPDKQPAAQEICTARGTPPWSAPSRGDWFAISFGVICAGLIAFSPVLAHHDAAAVMAILADSFTP